jgi:2-polyprenyl-6-methoxyphenol hydroxylase-like FAD-dependent oxidoreductase
MIMDFDVLIVGAGPAGLLLAGDVARARISCAIVERRAEESNLTRAFAVHARTLEQLDARGVADDLVATGTCVATLRLFGNIELDLSQLASRFPYVLITPQYHTERVLAERALALGAQIRRGVEVTGLRQDGDGVDVDVRHADGTAGRLRAAHVVGTDGVHSTVRDAVGLPFPGRSAIRSVMLADVRLSETPPDVLTLQAVGDAFALIAPFGDGWYRVIAWNRRHQVPDSAPVGLHEVRAVTRRALGRDFGMHEPRWMSRFHSDERQVPAYRVGRVLLAGDAAHVHSPAGGQGMNTSIQDAANLGWKLAATVSGWAPDGLLDTYHAERHPVGRQVLRGSDALLRMALTRPAALRAGRDVLARAAVHVPPVAGRLARAVSGVGIGYRAPRGAHPLTGKRVPDIRLADGRRLYEALRDGRFLLVTCAGDHDPVLAAGARSDRVQTATMARPPHTALLVRPDAYLAWATREPDTARRIAGITNALTQWCGVPVTTATLSH